ncbi:DUF3152 domain-containing protein [Kineosporia babensis]|uniref:DUF3152 domain-containing protein n=1 Tax=Kineosporia babensis TaxID=499548 RepID=A0A9X1SXR5_9ACTN|nr:DUF3152 domain-containing protein [Kineosporia babensis]MCD5315490.1 DUF3152 domain-containing protein [Kineosporia babensis]
MRTGKRLNRSLVLPLAAVMLALAGCSALPGGSSGEDSAATATTSPESAVAPEATAGATPSAAGESDSAQAAGEEQQPSPLPKGLTQKDVDAGVLSAKVKWKASGRLQTVKGQAKAPGKKGEVMKVRIQVEKGLKIDREKFADFVLATLNDKRSWTEKGKRRFARTDDASAAFTTVVLASPQTSADLCRPLQTMGKLSCRNGDRVVLTNYRWVKAIPEYQKNRQGYRQYVVNHEVGHALGHGHEYCAGKGELAPLMMQQTKGLLGCKPNPWPHP